MALCINDSGTWRNITTLCVNQSGTWRNILTGCINDSGTWRRFGGGGTPPTTLGSSFGGGYAICLSPTFSSGTVWIVAPSSTEVSRIWNSRNDAVTTAQAAAACGDWFVPTFSQLQNPGATCRTYWDSYALGRYWSSTDVASGAYGVVICNASPFYAFKPQSYCVRAFRCVTY